MTFRAMSNPIIVFDLDGTLIDTAPDLIATLNLVLTLENIPPVPFEKARAMIGGGVRPLIEEALIAQRQHVAEAAIDALFEQYIRHYQEHIAVHSRPYPGCEEALQALEAQGFVLAVCTNKYESLSVRLLDALGLKERFVAICGQDTFPMKKPDPEMLIRTIRQAGGDSNRAVMVGDSNTDVQTARAAGIPIIGVDFGYTDIPMAELAPDRLISHFQQLPALAMELMPAASGVN